MFIVIPGETIRFIIKGAKRAVVIPKYKEVPVFIIKNNMKTIGMANSDFKKFLYEV